MTSNNSINHVLYITFILILAVFFWTTKVFAASNFDLAVSPQIFQVELTPPAVAQANQTITLENNSTEPLPLTISYRPFRPSGDNGDISYLKENERIGNDPTILDKVVISQDGKGIDTLLLPPKSKKDLDFSVNVPGDEPPGDYYFSILFLENGDTASSSAQNSGSNAVGGVAMNVLLSIGPKSKTTGTIEDFSTPFFQTEGPVSFKVAIKNTSGHFIYPQAQIIITNMFGQKIGKVELLPLNVLANSSRLLPSKEQFVYGATPNTDKNKQIDQIQKELLANHGAMAIWPETFLLGPYKATLTVAFSDEGPLYVRSITFIGLPVYILTAFLICILLILTIRSRLHKRFRG